MEPAPSCGKALAGRPFREGLTVALAGAGAAPKRMVRNVAIPTLTVLRGVPERDAGSGRRPAAVHRDRGR